MSMKYLRVAAAWTMLALIVFWTLGPLAYRPKLAPPQLERFGAYLVLGALFVWAYGRPRLVGALLAVVAVALELGQLLVPGRDAGFPDAMAKVLGAIVGVGLVAVSRAALASRPTPSRAD
jgi:VanZ family protein